MVSIRQFPPGRGVLPDEIRQSGVKKNYTSDFSLLIFN